MKKKEIQRLIEESGACGFDFASDDYSACWTVARNGDMLLGWRMIEDEDGMADELLVAISYADAKKVTSLYEDIVIDFVMICSDDLRANTGSDLSLFDDTASPCDEGLIQMLPLFGKTYGEFLNDVFFWFGVWIDVDELLVDACTPESEVSSEDYRLTKKVLDHLGGECWLDIVYGATGESYRWDFAVANGEIWYSHAADYDVLDCQTRELEYGHVELADAVGMEALRDAVSLDFARYESWELEESGNALALLGLNLSDL